MPLNPWKDFGTKSDFYPFGSPMDERTFGSERYRFGFGGKENDNEIQDSGNSYDFGARIYDSRLGRWLACDPLMAKYPSLSPYAFCANNPILFVDYDGRDYGIRVEESDKGNKITIVANVYTVARDKSSWKKIKYKCQCENAFPTSH
ncbi:MAG: hypothetical protein PHI36_05500 [Bacteroidales bacterium]|nr:hypothetical protein [Bacteroidales bacterium]MDD4575865.1 hypothetical protein [Bacteroidales bacterium]